MKNKLDVITNYLKHIDENSYKQMNEQRYEKDYLTKIHKELKSINERGSFWICFWLFMIWLKI